MASLVSLEDTASTVLSKSGPRGDRDRQGVDRRRVAPGVALGRIVEDDLGGLAGECGCWLGHQVDRVGR
jgi:hypothetical protein